MEAQPHRRRRRHADDRLTVALQGDQGRPGLVAADEASGPVDRVDHPAPGRVAVSDDPELLADDRVVRALGADPLMDVGLDRPIRLGDRGEVRLRVDLEIVGPKPLHRDAVGHVRELEGEREIVSHRN